MTASQINLAWSATGGESGFRIERCGGAGCTSFGQIAQTAATVTSYVNTSLPPATLLRYRVRAFTAGGQSTYSNTAEATTRPATPTGLVATATAATQITLRWNDVAGDTGWRIERCTGAACTAFAAVGQVAGNVTTFIDSGVTTATLYRYRVHAFNAGGDSLGSNIAQLTSQPNVPTNTTATSVSANQINLTWAASGGESGFRIERCTGAGCTAFVQIVQTAANVTSYVNTSLPAATLLRYRVRAFTTGGQSAYSNTAEATTRPATPGGLMVTAMSPAQNNLRWNDVVGDTGMRIERCAGAGCAAFVAVGQVAGNVATFADTGVTAATLYRYRVRAFNAGGDSLASAVAELTSQPNAPTNMTATTMSASQINLAWSATGGESGFRIERCTGTGCTSFAQFAQTAANVTAYVNVSLPPATVLRYRVRAFTTGGQSAYSNISEATTRTATPTGLVATTTSALQITLRWSDVAGDAGVRVERCAGSACTNFSVVGQVAGNVATFVDTGVTAATLYRYRVHAFNAGGDSLPSGVVQAVTQ
jgi:hypothetical protein